MFKRVAFTIGLTLSIASTSLAELNLGKRLQFQRSCDTANCDGEESCDACSDRAACSCGCKYITGFGGWNRLEDYRGEDLFVERQGQFDDGFVVGAAVGRRFGSHLRREFEFAYRYNQGDQWSATPFFAQRNPQNWLGGVNCYSGMANLIYDLGDRDSKKWTPYVGGGVGFAFVDASLNIPNVQFQLDDSAFAYQGFGGILFHTGKRSSLFSEYRFFGTDQINLWSGGIAIGQYEYLAHSIIGGIQFRR